MSGVCIQHGYAPSEYNRGEYIKFHYTIQNGTQLKIYELFIYGI